MIPLSLATEAVAAAVAGLRPRAAQARDVVRTVADIVEAVRARGDEALVESTRRLDWPAASVDSLRVPLEQLESAFAALDADLREALRTARDDVTWFHRHELRSSWRERGPLGQELGIRYSPVRRAGLYVPGGLGCYASTVVMNAVPAQVAGVTELCICTPPGPDGAVNDSVLAAAWFMGVTEVYRVGGAQAVAAMAYGTDTIPRVDVICGPGNAYVMEAKRQVYGAVGIDGLAGPSEVVVVADGTARADWVAADMLAQEEHGSGATAILMGHSEGLCLAVADAAERLRADTGAAEAADARLHAFYPAAGSDFRDVATALVNEYAPEHLELHVADPDDFLSGVRAAGAIFLGGETPTAFGDYVAGSNHVLPTGGAARFSSSLSVDTFVRSSSLVRLGPRSLAALTPHLARLARSEGFVFHRVSAEMRCYAAPTPCDESGT